MNRSTEWLSKWIYLLAASFYFMGVFLRSWLVYSGSPTNARAMTLLLVWLALAASESFISHRRSGYFPFYLVIQTTLVFALLSLTSSDFYAALLVVPSMQAMLRLKTWIVAAWIGLCAVLMILLFMQNYETGEAIALALLNTAGSVFFSSYTLMMRRAQAAREKNQALAADLARANDQLQEYSTQLEQLAVARERNRLARDLHDSVTQTVFSMTLTSQSALLLLERNPGQVRSQLERLYLLARSALTEMQALIAELKPDLGARGGLEAALRRYLADSRFAESLSVSLEVEGDGQLNAMEELGLFHIAQEALNNILKHAGVSQAEIHLHLAMPFWMEITDHGQGFSLQQVQQSGKVGLASMRERAGEIGWRFQISSAHGAGTCIRVEKSPLREVQG